MTMSISAVFEDGVLRPTAPLKLADGARVQLIILGQKESGDDPPKAHMAASILAEIAALSTGDGDPRTSQDHDRVLYGDPGVR